MAWSGRTRERYASCFFTGENENEMYRTNGSSLRSLGYARCVIVVRVMVLHECTRG